MENVDKIISAKWVIPVDKSQSVIDNGSVMIKDDKIVDVLPTEEATAKYQADERISLPGHALIPGLVNTHGHAAMTLFRGMADDLELMTWLNDHIWPAEGKWVSPEFVADGTRLAIAEMIRSGTTCFSDNYFYGEEVANEILKSGIRGQICSTVIDFPTPGAADANEGISNAMALYEKYKDSDQIMPIFGPHAPYTVSDEPIEKIAKLAKEHGIPVQMHVHETQTEVDGSVEKYSKRPIKRLYDLGLLGPHMQCVHMTALNEEDISLIVETGSHIMHCPESNLKLASGFCPVDKLQKQGVNVALGTDGAASNNDLDMFGEMRTAAQLAKAVAGNAEALPAYEALAMSTLNGAISMGKEDKFGSLEAGKFADIVAVDLSDLESQPIFDPVSHLVYATTRNQVTDVWVGGKQLLANRELTTLSLSELIANAVEWKEKIVAGREENSK